MYCNDCTLDAEFVRRCDGDDCRAGICPLCEQPDGLCIECRAEQAKGIWQRRAAAKRAPICPTSGEPADECRHMEGDEL